MQQTLRWSLSSLVLTGVEEAMVLMDLAAYTNAAALSSSSIGPRDSGTMTIVTLRDLKDEMRMYIVHNCRTPG